MDDEEVNNILKEVVTTFFACNFFAPQSTHFPFCARKLKKKQEQDRQLRDMLKKQGINTDGMNFGGGMDPDMMEKVIRNIQKDKPQE
jgi:hypothetical protein